MTTTKWRLGAFLGMLLACAPTIASAQMVPCEWGWEGRTDGWQAGQGPWLTYSVETRLKQIPCQTGAVAYGAVEGVGSSSLRAEGAQVATAQKQVFVQRFGRYQVLGRYARYYLIGGEVNLGSDRKEVNIVPVQTSGDPAADCAAMDGEWRGTWCDFKPQSPLLIDVTGNGFQLTRPAHGVQFDIDGDGVMEQVSWTKPDSDDTFLAMDRNGNGKIDNGTELFGNNTPVYGPLANARIGEDATETASNGFDALRYLGGPSYGRTAAPNDTLNTKDPGWANLLLWRDANHNGISEPDELTRVANSPLRSVDLNYNEPIKVRSPKGNDLAQVSSVKWGDERRTIVDVWLDTK